MEVWKYGSEVNSVEVWDSIIQLSGFAPRISLTINQ